MLRQLCLVYTFGKDDTAVPSGFKRAVRLLRLLATARDDSSTRASWRKVARAGREMPRLLVAQRVVVVLRAAALAFLLLSTPSEASAKKIPVRSRAGIAQPWIGVTEDELSIFRLDLHMDGGGLGAYVYLDGTPHLFNIKSWKIDRYSIEIDCTGIDWAEDANATLRGKVVGDKMELSVRDKSWHRKLLLRPESSIEPKLDKLREQMAARQRGEI
jgi:hypothetical protein